MDWYRSVDRGLGTADLYNLPDVALGENEFVTPALE